MTRRTVQSLPSQSSDLPFRPASASTSTMEPTWNQATRGQGAQAPVLPLTPFMHFSKEERPRVRMEFPEAKWGVWDRITNERWMALTEQQRALYEAMAAADMDRYQTEWQTSLHMAGAHAGNDCHCAPSTSSASSAPVKPEEFTKPFCDFLTQNPTIFHAVDYFKGKLGFVGYKELPSRENWAGKIEAGGKYYTTRNGSSIIAFQVGKGYKPGNGVAMIAGHIDALTARLKPVSTKPNSHGYLQLGVAQYAGALNETWWDRDLSIGGKVIVRDEETGKTTAKLVKLDWPIARIPTLAPHFGIGMMGHNNSETEAVPIIGLDNSDLDASTNTAPAVPLGGKGSFTSNQPPKLVKLIAGELGIKDYSSILNWELELFDHAPATVGGIDKEFIFAGRIDDKLCSWAALEALLLASSSNDDGVIKLVALFDDEEIGSLLRQGARGNFLPGTIERVVEALATEKSPFGPGILGQTYARSFLVSSDVTHAAHPNFPATNLAGHSPRLNVGVALCVDGSGHMTTDSVSTSILNRVAELGGCVNQTHMIRNDSRSGGTVGPMLSSAMGVRASDAGIPQLSMHSIRATTGSLDPGLGVKFYKSFLDNFEKVDAEWDALE